MSSRPTSPNVPGADAPRIPSLDLDSQKEESPSPTPKSQTPEPVVTRQPEAKEEPKIGPLIPLSEFTKAHDPSAHKQETQDSFKRPRGAKRRACAAGWGRFLQGTLVSRVWIVRVLLCLAIGVVILIAFAIGAGITFGSAAANGAIWMLIGNLILRATHHAGYIDSNEVVAIVGAIGGILAVMCIGAVLIFVPRTSFNERTGEAEHSWLIRVPAVVCTGALAGPIGVSILKKHQFDLQGLDTLHAARAGALGATVMGPVMILALPVLALVVGALFTPLYGAMSLGVEYMVVKTQEPISDDGCCQSCMCAGDDTDSDIQERMERHANPRKDSLV